MISRADFLAADLARKLSFTEFSYYLAIASNAEHHSGDFKLGFGLTSIFFRVDIGFGQKSW